MAPFSPICAAVAAIVAPVLAAIAATLMNCIPAITPAAAAEPSSIAFVIARYPPYTARAAATPKMMGDSQDQLSAMSWAPPMRRSKVSIAIPARTERPSIAPFTSPWKASLFPISFIRCRTGWNAIRAWFSKDVQICPKVLGMLSNFALVSSAA